MFSVKTAMKVSTILSKLTLISLFFLLSILTISNISCRTLTPLQECMKLTQNSSLISTQTNDSAFLDKCARYSRIEVVEKYGFMKLMVPYKKFNERTSKYVVQKDKKTKKPILVPASDWTRSDILLYIEKGVVPQ